MSIRSKRMNHKCEKQGNYKKYRSMIIILKFSYIIHFLFFLHYLHLGHMWNHKIWSWFRVCCLFFCLVGETDGDPHLQNFI